MEPFNEQEIDDVVGCIQALLPSVGDSTVGPISESAGTSVSAKEKPIDWPSLRSFIADSAHVSHKDWAKTEDAGDALAAIINTPDHNAAFRSMMERVLVDGNWPGAADHAAKMNRCNSTAKQEQKSNTAKTHDNDSDSGGHDARPWIVLVTGLNGIRKTSAIYQPWFKDILLEALQLHPQPQPQPQQSSSSQSPPSAHSSSLSSAAVSSASSSSAFPLRRDDLPDGSDSFFRQLDYMITTLAHRAFAKLYTEYDSTVQAEIDAYAKAKDAIFQRYRKLAESLGVLLCKSAQRHGLNVIVETSGRDVAMFNYIDRFFADHDDHDVDFADNNEKQHSDNNDDDENSKNNTTPPSCIGGLPSSKKETKRRRRRGYRKLAVHFGINDITFAERSVDRRMVLEMEEGKAAVASGDVRAIIRANAGGPYGSAVLKGVQRDSDAVWKSIIEGTATTPTTATATAPAPATAVGAQWYKAHINVHVVTRKKMKNDSDDDGELEEEEYWTAAAGPALSSSSTTDEATETGYKIMTTTNKKRERTDDDDVTGGEEEERTSPRSKVFTYGPPRVHPSAAAATTKKN